MSSDLRLALIATNFTPLPEYFLLNSTKRSSYPTATGQRLHVKQTTTTLASFMSGRLYSLPSTPGRALNSGACVPISSSADHAGAHRATSAKAKNVRRTITSSCRETGSASEAADTAAGKTRFVRNAGEFVLQAAGG